MAIFEKLYVDKVNLLRQNGFDSSDKYSTLGNTEFLGMLLYKFLEAYQKSNKTNDPSLFYVKTSAFFEKIQAPIKIVFNYKYSPAEAILSIQNLYVTMKGVSQTFNLSSNTELPNPEAIANHMVKAYENHPQRKLDDFSDAIEKHTSLLVQRGFDENGLSNRDSIENFKERWVAAFKEGLMQNIATYFCPFWFDVHTKGYFNNNTDIVEFKFGYEYDPKSVSVTLKTLTAKMDETRIYYLKNESELPHSLTIHKQFSENNRLLNQIIPALSKKYGTGTSAKL